MSESMKLKVSARKDKSGSEYFEGIVTLPTSNLGLAKVQKVDGTTKFSTRSACVQAARNAAKKLGCGVLDETSTVKQAAKKSSVKKTPKVVIPSWLKN